MFENVNSSRCQGQGFSQHFESWCFFAGTFIIIIINYVIWPVFCVCVFVCLFVCLWKILFLASTPLFFIKLFNLLLHCQHSLFHCFVVVPFFVSVVYFVLFCFLFFLVSISQCCQLLHILSVIIISIQL